MKPTDQKGQKPTVTVKSAKKVGKYTINFAKKLGKGQFGEVYAAEINQTKQTIAAKIIDKNNSDLANESAIKNALIRQIQIMKNLKSINTIEFIDVIETKNNIYIFQQLANQGTLGDLLSEKKRFSQQVATGYIIQLLNGFSQLIYHGIIHRDIKPTNILIKDNTLKLADFGMSRYSNKTSAMISIVGSPYYMAPQIIQQKKYSYKCDIWSLGVVFYELVVGQIPWLTTSSNIKDLLNTIKQMCKKGIQFPQKLHISQNYKNLVRGCLKVNQQQRYDWTQIYNHKIFDGKIKKINPNFQTFTITELRKKIHLNNVNLQKLLAKLPQALNHQDFSNLLKALNSDINEKQIDKLFINLSKGTDYASKKQACKYFQEHGITPDCIKSKFNPQQQKQRFHELIQKISNGIEEKETNIFQLYRKFDKNKQNRINFDHFTELILSICPDMSKEDIQIVFQHFNTQKTKTIPFEQFYQNFCKAVQIPALKDSKVSEGIRKMQQRKKKQ